MTHIVKRGAREYESFSREKLHASIIAACLGVRASQGSAATAATAVCDAVETWLQARPEVTSEDIRRIAARTLETTIPTQLITTLNTNISYKEQHSWQKNTLSTMTSS